MFNNIYVPRNTGLQALYPVNPQALKHSDLYFWSLFSPVKHKIEMFSLSRATCTWFARPQSIQHMWQEFSPYEFKSFVPPPEMFFYFSKRNDPDEWIPVPKSQYATFKKSKNYHLPNQKIIDLMVEHYKEEPWDDYDILMFIWYVLAGYNIDMKKSYCQPFLVVLSHLMFPSLYPTVPLIYYLCSRALKHYNDDIDSSYWVLMTKLIDEAPDMRFLGFWDIMDTPFIIPFTVKLYQISVKLGTFGFLSTWNIRARIPYSSVKYFFPQSKILDPELIFVVAKSGKKLMLVTAASANYNLFIDQIKLIFSFIREYNYYSHIYLNVFLDSVCHYIDRNRPSYEQQIEIHTLIDKHMTGLLDDDIIGYSYHEWIFKYGTYLAFRTYCQVYKLTERLIWNHELLSLFVITLNVVKFQIYLDVATTDQTSTKILQTLYDLKFTLGNRRNTLHFFLTTMMISYESYYQNRRVNNEDVHYFIALGYVLYDEICAIFENTKLSIVFSKKYPDGLREYIIARYFGVNVDYAKMQNSKTWTRKTLLEYKSFYLKKFIHALFYHNKQVIEYTEYYDFNIRAIDVPDYPAPPYHVSGYIRYPLDATNFSHACNVTWDLREVKLAAINHSSYDFIDDLPYALAEIRDTMIPQKFKQHYHDEGDYLVNTVTDLLWKKEDSRRRNYLNNIRRELFGRFYHDINDDKFNDINYPSMFDPAHDGVIEYNHSSDDTDDDLNEVD
jgi:hypothetical protein